jgi:hypothetical protein
MIHNMILESKQDGTDVYRVTDWEPFEISIVSIPADNSVGVGRGFENQIIEKFGLFFATASVLKVDAFHNLKLRRIFGF